MTAKLDRQAIAVIEAILNRGNNAVVKRNKDGVVVAEESQQIKYRTAPKGGQ